MSLSRKGIMVAGIVVIGAATIGYLRLHASEPIIKRRNTMMMKKNMTRRIKT